MPQSTQILLDVASVCIVLLTLITIAAIGFVLSVINEMRAFVRLARHEVQGFIDQRDHAMRRMRIARRWLSIFFWRSLWGGAARNRTTDV